MSLVRRTYLSLLCDAGCGNRIDTEAAGNIGARVDAAQKGWRYVEGMWLVDSEQRSDYHRSRNKEQTVRALDICPDCQPPAAGTRIAARAEAS